MGDLLLLDGGHGEAGIFEHSGEIHHHVDHGDEAIVGGGKYSGEYHSTRHMKDKLGTLRTHGCHAATDGFPSQTVAHVDGFEKIFYLFSFHMSFR